MASSSEDEHHVESSGASLTPPPHSSPEPASPSAQVTNDFAAHQIQHSHHAPPGVVVPSSLPYDQSQLGQSGQPAQPEKPPRKKPGRKPGWAKLQREMAAAAGEPMPEPKRRAPRKPKDPDAPIQRRKRKTESLDAPSAQAILGQLPPRAELQPRPEFRVPSNNMSEMGNNEGIPRLVTCYLPTFHLLC